MTERQLSGMSDMMQSISIDPSALLTTSTINALHFPDLTTSGISDFGGGGGGGKGISLNLDGVGMCDSIMTESFYEPSAAEEATLVNSNANGLQPDTSSLTSSLKNLSKKDSSTAQKKRRSRKAMYDAVVDGVTFDKIETVNIIEEQIEPDDAWLFQMPGNGTKPNADNIFSWVHKEFKENDINATKHRLLCKLDDMSNARTIRSVSCHSFTGNQRSDSVKRSATEQQVHPEPRLTSPARSTTPLFNRNNSDTRPTSPAGSSPLRHTVAITNHIRSRDSSRDRERVPLDYTDLEVMAKLQLENLRQAEKQGPLSKRHGSSSSNLLNTDSRDGSPSSVFGATRNTSPVGTTGYLTPRRSYSPSPAAARRIPIRKNSFVVTESQYTHVLPSVSPRSGSPAVRTDPPDAKPPVAPKPTSARNGVKPNNHRRSNTQTISTNLGGSFDLPDATEVKPPTPTSARTGVVPSSSTSTSNRPRPPVSRPLQTYRGSQTSYNNSPRAQTTTTTAPATAVTAGTTQKLAKKPGTDLSSTFTAKQFASTENNFLHDLSNKPLTTPVRSQAGAQRRIPTQSSVEQIPPSTSSGDMSATATSIPRSASSLSQGRKSGIPTIGKQPQRPGIPTPTRPTTSTTLPSSQSSDSMMATRNLRGQPAAVTRPQIPDSVSPTSSWNEGCY